VTRIKISGIVQPADAEMAVALGADIITCVFNAQSRRYVTLEQAWAVRRAMPRGVPFVGVFVDTPLPVVQVMADACQLDYVQLFGHEGRADIDALGPRGFKAVTAIDAGQVEAAGKLFLGRRPRRPDGPGLLIHLTGPVSNAWDLVAPIAQRVPLVLAAGGLGPESVRQALATAYPWAVDVWDAVESEPGRLDRGRLERFIYAAREADAALGTGHPREGLT
jgi:phosphoribosylanthranilate isomerase